LRPARSSKGSRIPSAGTPGGHGCDADKSPLENRGKTQNAIKEDKKTGQAGGMKIAKSVYKLLILKLLKIFKRTIVR